jgi:hypothetical protein
VSRTHLATRVYRARVVPFDHLTTEYRSRCRAAHSTDEPAWNSAVNRPWRETNRGLIEDNWPPRMGPFQRLARRPKPH